MKQMKPACVLTYIHINKQIINCANSESIEATWKIKGHFYKQTQHNKYNIKIYIYICIIT